MFTGTDVRTLLRISQQGAPNPLWRSVWAVPNPDSKPDAAGFSMRLNEAMHHRGMPQRCRGAELRRRYKVSAPTTHNWLNAGHMPKPDVVRQMAADFGVDYEWLYFGTGEPDYRKSADPTVEVPLWDADGSAGFGALNEEAQVIGSLTFKRSSLEKRGIDFEHADAFYVRGLSMLPRLKTGDVVLFDRHDVTVMEAKMYVVRWNGHEFVKRLRYFDGRWHLCSDNQSDQEWKDPKPIHDGDDFEVKGRVRWIGSWEE